MKSKPSAKKMLFFAVILCAGVSSATPLLAQPASASPLSTHLPEKVNWLREFISTVGERPESKLGEAPCAKRAVDESVSWLLRVVDSDWLPPDPNVLRDSLVMRQNAFGPNDVTYLQWTANDRMVQAAQTRTVLLIRVAPPSGSGASAATQAAKVDWAKRIITDLMRQEVEIWTYEPTGRQKVKKIITAELLDLSFDRGRPQPYPEGIHVRCALPVRPDGRPTSPRFWWESVNWWTDGRAVGIHMFKKVGGPWRANYRDNRDATWFERSDARKTRSPAPWD